LPSWTCGQVSSQAGNRAVVNRAQRRNSSVRPVTVKLEDDSGGMPTISARQRQPVFEITADGFHEDFCLRCVGDDARHRRITKQLSGTEAVQAVDDGSTRAGDHDRWPIALSAHEGQHVILAESVQPRRSAGRQIPQRNLDHTDGVTQIAVEVSSPQGGDGIRRRIHNPFTPLKAALKIFV
jgi:hypothetical protein